MSFRGQFKSGVIVFDSPPPLPEGAVVEVRPVDSSSSAGRERDDFPSWGEVLKDFVGKAEGLPPDMARNHDRYIHGTPNRRR